MITPSVASDCVVYCICLAWFICQIIYIQVCIYIQLWYSLMVWMSVCPCVLLAVSSMVHYWINAYCIVMCIYCTPMWALHRYGCIFVHIHITISLHLPSHNIARCGICLTVLCSLILFCLCLFILVTDLLLFLCFCVNINYCTATFLLMLHDDSFASGDERLCEMLCKYAYLTNIHVA